MEGRKAEFADHGWNAGDIPDPQYPQTFLRSKLNWDESGAGEHARLLALYRDLIALRRSETDLADERTRVGRVRASSARTRTTLAPQLSARLGTLTLPSGALAPGFVVAERYEIQDVVGVGGTGIVYRATDRTLDEVLALKMLRRAVALRPLLRERQAECEEQGELPADTNNRFMAAGFYRIVQPRCFGGYEFALPDFIRVMIEVARGCSDSAWVLALTSGHTVLAAQLAESAHALPAAAAALRVTARAHDDEVRLPLKTSG